MRVYTHMHVHDNLSVLFWCNYSGVEDCLIVHAEILVRISAQNGIAQIQNLKKKKKIQCSVCSVW